MHPRLGMLRSLYKAPVTSVSIASFLVPFVLHSQQHRSASILASLSDVPTAYNKRIRRGRGPSSGKGKTSGRGHKGQKQHGKVPRGFNGGQTPDIVVSGKRGFKNVHALRLAKINVDRLQTWIDQGRLDITKPVTVKELHESRCTHGIKDGVKLLARNAQQLTSPIHITVSRASAAAIKAVEAAGGSVQTRYYTYNSIQRIFKGLTHPTQSLLSSTTTGQELATNAAVDAAHLKSPAEYRYRLPDPASRKDIEYYRDPAHRGYLSYQLQNGESPSLFFRTPFQTSNGKDRKPKERKGSGARKEDNKLW